jgi:hypothetical protein
MSGYTKVQPEVTGEFKLSKENFGQINDAVYDLKTSSIYAKDNGVTTDGADCTTAFQTLIDTAPARTRIVLPPGDIKANIIVTDNVWLSGQAGPAMGSGASPTRTRIVAANNALDVIKVKSNPSGGFRQNITLEHLTTNGGLNGFASYEGVAWLVVEDVEFSSHSGSGVYFEGWLEESIWRKIRMSGGTYGFRMAHVGNPFGGGTNYIDKTSFEQIYTAGAAKNGWRLEANVFDGITWSECNCTSNDEHGFYLDGGANGLTFNQFSTEGNGRSGKKNRTTLTGTVSSGATSATLASATGWATGDGMTIKGAGANGVDFTIVSTAQGGPGVTVSGTTVSWTGGTGTTVTNPVVTNAEFDEIYFNNTIATPGPYVTFIGGVYGGEAAQGRLRYSMNFAQSQGVVLIAPLIAGGIPVYDPQRKVIAIGGSVPLRRPTSYSGWDFLGLALPMADQGEGTRAFYGGVRGQDTVFGLPDSIGNGGGTFGVWTWRKGNSNKDELMKLDATLNRLTICPASAGGSLQQFCFALTYGTTVATDTSKGNFFTLTVTDGVAFTMSAPTNPAKGQQITYDILNSSGGAMGAITWNAAFKLDATGFVNPANGKSKTITFFYNGTNWRQVGATSADI